MSEKLEAQADQNKPEPTVPENAVVIDLEQSQPEAEQKVAADNQRYTDQRDKLVQLHKIRQEALRTAKNKAEHKAKQKHAQLGQRMATTTKTV